MTYRGWIRSPPVLGWETDPKWALIGNEFYDPFHEWRAALGTDRYGLPPKGLRHGSFHEWLACGTEDA